MERRLWVFFFISSFARAQFAKGLVLIPGEFCLNRLYDPNNSLGHGLTSCLNPHGRPARTPIC
jgi:hypothetical protein